MSDKAIPTINPEDSEVSNSKSFELTLGDKSVVLPEECRNSIFILMEEAKEHERSWYDIESITKEVIKPDPLFMSEGRFLECIPVYQGLGAEGSFIKNKPGLEFSDPYFGGVLVFPNNPEYVVFDFAIEPGEEYTPYYLGKRDKEGRGYVISNLGTQDLKEAIAISEELIECGHPKPIPLPKDDNDVTDIEFSEGFTGKLKTDHARDSTGFLRMSAWECEFFSPQGKSLAKTKFMETPLEIVDLVNDTNHLKKTISRARADMQKARDENNKFNDIPF